jgi:hypothetical protein
MQVFRDPARACHTVLHHALALANSKNQASMAMLISDLLHSAGQACL